MRSKNTLDKRLEEAILFAVTEILKRGINLEFRYQDPIIPAGPYADLVKNTIVIYEGIEHSPMGYMLLRHEFYHFTVFPRTIEVRERVIQEALKLIPSRIRPEFFEDHVLLYTAYNIVANSIVDRYGIERDPYKDIYYQGWEQLIWREEKQNPLVAELRILFTKGGVPNVPRAIAEAYEALYSNTW